MNTHLPFKKGVKVCYKDACVTTHGQNAKLIVSAISVAVVCLGAASIIRSLK